MYGWCNNLATCTWKRFLLKIWGVQNLSGKRKKFLKKILLTFSIILLCIILIFPIYWMIVTSLTPTKDFLVSSPNIFLNFSNATLSFYKNAIQSRDVFLWFYNSSLITGTTVLITISISIFAGYALSRYKYLKKIGYSLLIFRMLPPTLMIIPLYVIFSNLGLLNNPLSVIIANTSYAVPFGTWMLKGFFDGIPRELEEAAEVDGCSIFGSVVRIAIPLALPGIVATAMYTAILTWSEFVFSLTLLSRPAHWTVTVGLYSFSGEHITAWNELMATAVMIIIPLVILFGFLSRYLIGGLKVGGVKG